jgi:two-component sensor histidine kinase
MLVGKRLIGMIALDKKEVGFYTQEHVRLVEAFAAQAAVAVENALLYEQAQQDADALSILLHEVNHRVKNNLTGIIGLLYLARNRARVTDRITYQSTMDDLIGRIRGLASVHSMLSASEWTPLRLSNLAAEIIHAALQTLPHDKHVSVDVSASPVQVTSDQAHNLALVINELATNTIKYALGGRDTARITFQSRLDGKMVRCKFQDNGPGYPEEVLRLERHNVGFELIQNIVRDSLHGELSLHNDHGAVAIIQFKAEV